MACERRPGASGLPNPASLYCHALGYQEVTTTVEEGQLTACVFPDGSACEQWSFYYGNCAPEFSICARRGLRIKHGDRAVFGSRAVCVDDAGAKVGAVAELADIVPRRPKYPDTSPILLQVFGASAAGSSPQPTDTDTDTGDTAPPLPVTFSWRNYRGNDWMTSVKNQQACGGCWAFATVGALEAMYNIRQNNPNLDLDLSEEYLISDCPLSGDPGDCCSGFADLALREMVANGIPDDGCMSFDDHYDPADPSCVTCDSNGCPSCAHPNQCSNMLCSEACADMDARRVFAADYGLVGAGLTGQARINAIKQALISHGPLVAYIRASGLSDAAVNNCDFCWDFNDDHTCSHGACVNGQCDIDTDRACDDDHDCDEDWNEDGVCNEEDCPTDHFVVITGYDDTNQTWEFKNSWGDRWPSPANGGYAQMEWGECYIEGYVLYVEPANQQFSVVGCISGAQGVSVGHRVQVAASMASGGDITIGIDSLVTGRVEAVQTVTLQDRATVDGDVTGGTAITKYSGATILGTEVTPANVTYVEEQVDPVSWGSQDVIVPNDGEIVLAPGVYGQLRLGDRALVLLTEGTYVFSAVELGNDSQLASEGDSSVVEIHSGLGLVVRDRVDVAIGETDSHWAFLVPGGQVEIGADSEVNARITAPASAVVVRDRGRLFGCVSGASVTIGNDAHVAESL